MATTPNYYYNSPWIEAAGRNLASALRPEDPDVLREREQKRWEFDYAKTKAANEATDRENKKFASEGLGKIAGLFENPILDAQGKPDVEATRRAAAGIAKEIYQRGGPEFVNEVEAASGPLSAAFMAKQNLRAQIEAGQYGRMGAQNEFKAGESQKDRDFKREQDDADWARRFEYLDKQGAQHLAEINAKAAADPTGHAITLSPEIGKGILTGIYQHIRSTNKKMDDAAIYKLYDEIANDTSQVTKNYVTSTERIWNARFPGGVYQRKKGFFDFGNNDDEYLTPDFSGGLPAFGGTSATGATGQTTAPAAEEPRTLGGAATTPPVSNPLVDRGNAEAEMEAASRAQAAADNERFGKTPAAKTTSTRPTGKSKSSPIPVKTPEDVTKLPKGTWFIAPDGRVGQSKGPRK